MKGLEIHLKSGHVITVDATDVTTTRRGDVLAELQWVTPEGAKRKLHGIYGLSDVAAVVVLR